MDAGAKILVVEDDLSIRETVAELLEAEGFHVSCACNGAEALDRLEAGEAPQLILLDLMMPVMDGWEFRSRQRRDPRLAAIPVVVLSAGAGSEARLPPVDAQAFLPKPFEVSRLLRTVDQLLPH